MSSGSLTGFSTEDGLNFPAFFSKGPTVIIAVFSSGRINKGQIDSWPVLCEEKMSWFFRPKTKALNSKHGYGTSQVIDHSMQF